MEAGETVRIFDPSEGVLIREAPCKEVGYWAGAPGVYYDDLGELFYLTYRYRNPRGADPDRGFDARIAVSEDGISFRDIVSIKKWQYRSPSIERSDIIRGRDRVWRYFTSYVDPEDGRWRVDVIRASSPDKINTRERELLFKPSDFKLEGIKDPAVFGDNGTYYMFVSVAVPVESTGEESHKTRDIYNTGECLSQSGAFKSTDLERWDWMGIIFKTPESGWDAYCSRITAVLKGGGRYNAFYDGASTFSENYEEKSSMATSHDLVNWERVNPGPMLLSPHGSGSVRYVDAVEAKEKIYFYYEFTTENGSHDLMVRIFPKGTFFSA